MRIHFALPLAALAVITTLAGCAGYPNATVRAGAGVDQVLAAMGPPTARHAGTEGGSRLEYSHAPFGRQSFMVDVDRGGRVTGVEQVLDERHFQQVQPGMDTATVLGLLGTPSDRRGGGWQPGEVWSWRHVDPFCTWFQASVDAGRVTSTGMGPDPLCTVRFGRD